MRSDASLSVGRRCVSCLTRVAPGGRSCSRERPLVNAIRWTDNKTKNGESGTYEVTGSDLVIHRTVAFIPANMVPNNAASFSFDVRGDTLSLTPRTRADGNVLRNNATLKFQRVE